MRTLFFLLLVPVLMISSVLFAATGEAPMRYLFRCTDSGRSDESDFVGFYLKVADSRPLFVASESSMTSLPRVSEFQVEEIVYDEELRVRVLGETFGMHKARRPSIVNYFGGDMKGVFVFKVWVDRFKYLLTDGDSKLVRLRMDAYYSDGYTFEFAYKLFSEPFWISRSEGVVSYFPMGDLSGVIPDTVIRKFSYDRKQLDDFEEACQRLEEVHFDFETGVKHPIPEVDH